MPKLASEKLLVYGKDLANLRESGLTDTTILANELRTETNSRKLGDILNRGAGSNCCMGGLVFPYRTLNGEVNCFARVRPHYPRIRDGKPIKYEQPVNEPCRAYYPAACVAKLRDGETTVYVTEGEKKALALSQLGLSVVGIGGVYAWKQKGTNDLISDLAAIIRPEQIIYVAFDYDPKPETRRYVAGAARRLARALRKAGAKEVYEVELPPGADGSKQGVDDFLVANCAESFHKLVQQAQTVPILNDFAPLTKAEGRTDTSNAARLGTKYGELIRWVGPWDKWLIWDGSRWKTDQVLAIESKAKDIAADLFVEIAAVLRENKE